MKNKLSKRALAINPTEIDVDKLMPRVRRAKDGQSGIIKKIGKRIDQRILRTKKRIFDAFIKLLEGCAPDKIRVKDICEAACINKTTFYKHYDDSTELAREVDETLTERVVESFEYRECLFEKPEEYVIGLTEAIENETESLSAVYRGRKDFLCAKLEAKLRRFYDASGAPEEKKVMISFAISGVVRVLIERIFTQKNERCDKKSLSAHLVKMIRRVIPAS